MEKKFNNLKLIPFFLLAFIISSCTTKPQPIKMGDTCDFCIMGVADNRFGAEIITNKGKIYKFDDIHCLLGFMKANTVPPKEQKSIVFIVLFFMRVLFNCYNYSFLKRMPSIQKYELIKSLPIKSL